MIKYLSEKKGKGRKMKYTVIITYDSEYKGYVVDVPELTGCMSQGKSLDEALKNIKDAIKGWLFVEKKHKRTVPGLLRGLIRKSGLTVDEFLKAK